MPTALVPSVDRVVIRVEDEKERMIGSIILPQTAWLEYKTGIVIAVGPGPSGESGRGEMHSKIGDRVIFPPSLGRLVPIRKDDGHDDEVYVIRQHEIALTLKEE